MKQPEERVSQTDEKTFPIDGMTCASCELTVREEVEELGFVDSAQAVREAVTTAGHEVTA